MCDRMLSVSHLAQDRTWRTEKERQRDNLESKISEGAIGDEF
jgi:hypothetical protein